MTARLDQGRLDEIRARHAAITPGPWTGVFASINHFGDDYPEHEIADAEFIAAAPQDVADLLAEVEALQGAVATVECAYCGAPVEPHVGGWHHVDPTVPRCAPDVDAVAAPVAGGTS